MATITVTNAATYSTNGEIAYELTYSEGTKVRAVESKGNIIRKECMAADGIWKLVGKAYVVDHSKQRAAEKIKQQVKEWLAA